MTVFIQKGDTPLSVRQATKRGMSYVASDLALAGARRGDEELLRVTAAEARAGTATEKLMSAASVEQHMLANAIGWGQTWSLVNRQGGAEYINETGRPILISYHDTSSSQCRLSGAPAGAGWTMIAAARYGVSATAIIPAGWRYMFSYTPDYVAILM